MTTKNENGSKVLRFLKSFVEIVVIVAVFLIVISLLCNLEGLLSLSISDETPFHEALWSVLKTGSSNFWEILKNFLADTIEDAKKFEDWGKSFWD